MIWDKNSFRYLMESCESNLSLSPKEYAETKIIYFNKSKNLDLIMSLCDNKDLPEISVVSANITTHNDQILTEAASLLAIYDKGAESSSVNAALALVNMTDEDSYYYVEKIYEQLDADWERLMDNLAEKIHLFFVHCRIGHKIKLDESSYYSDVFSSFKSEQILMDSAECYCDVSQIFLSDEKSEFMRYGVDYLYYDNFNETLMLGGD